MKFARLRGDIRTVFGTQANFAEALGVDNSSLSAKLNGKTPWKREEIELACKLLGIEITQVFTYFFDEKF